MSNFSFDFNENDFRPLAARMRPTTLAQYCGQSHLLGEGKPLRKAIEAGYAHSMIFWGPPGTGKTTLLLALLGFVPKLLRNVFKRKWSVFLLSPAALKKFVKPLKKQNKINWRVCVPFCLWTKCIVSTKASKMPFCRISKTAPLFLLVPPQKILPLN